MKKTKKTYAKGFYIFESKAAANSNYIETLTEAKLLLTYANYFLKDYLKIYDYVITKDGWQMAVKLLSREKILQARNVLKDENASEIDFADEIWRIISERIRLFIAIYAKQINARRGRSGSLVHSNYSKYYFDSVAEAKSHLSLIRNQNIKLYQKRKKYRGLKTHYKINQKTGKGSVFLCSRDIKSEAWRLSKMDENHIFKGLSSLVLSKMVVFTENLHKNSFSPQQSHKSLLIHPIHPPMP